MGTTVSILIANRNYGRYLPAAIRSVVAQTFEDWECIVVDDGSTDDSHEVLARLAELEPRLRVIARAHGGVSAARNAGLAHAGGTFIQFLDADDVLHPQKLQLQVLDLRADEKLDGLFAATGTFEDERDLERWSTAEASDGVAHAKENLGLAAMIEWNPVTIEAPLLRRALLERVGGFDERLERMEDWDLWLRCLIGGARYASMSGPMPLAMVREHGARTSGQVAPMLLAEVDVRMKIAGMLQHDADRSRNDRRLDDASAHAGWLIGTGGDPVAGLRYLVPAARKRWRPRWLAWCVALLLMRVPGGSRIVHRIRRGRTAGRTTALTRAR